MERLKICGRLETRQFLDCGFSHMISIGDHDDALDGLRLPEIQPENYLCLRFSDTEDPSRSDCPTLANISPLFEWLSEVQIQRLLVHCTAGIGRSPAIALLALSALDTEEPPLMHLERVTDSSECSYIWPNRLVVELGDQILKREGVILSALDEWQRVRAEKPQQKS